MSSETLSDNESCLDKLARYFADLEISDLQPPVGTQRLEEFLEAQWGESAGRTYNKNLSILRDFFKFHVLRGNLHGNPTLAIERARKRDVYRRRSTTTRFARLSPPRMSCATESRCGCSWTTGYARGR